MPILLIHYAFDADGLLSRRQSIRVIDSSPSSFSSFKVAPVDKLSVVIAMLLAVAFLGEVVTVKQWVGGLLILAGAIVIVWR